VVEPELADMTIWEDGLPTLEEPPATGAASPKVDSPTPSKPAEGGAANSEDDSPTLVERPSKLQLKRSGRL
jgi:hypothetical protein